MPKKDTGKWKLDRKRKKEHTFFPLERYIPSTQLMHQPSVAMTTIIKWACEVEKSKLFKREYWSVLKIIKKGEKLTGSTDYIFTH